MEARTEARLPRGDAWLYEPKWDGFRCLVFRDGASVYLQSKSGQPLARYFPEVAAFVLRLPDRRFVADGELTVDEGFDALLQRVHPAASRVKRLSEETPARLRLFDLLVDPKGRDLTSRPLAERRAALEKLELPVSPATDNAVEAEKWLKGLDGCDGVMAKLLLAPYRAGERDAMVKVKRIRTADCVIGGFRPRSLLLGLYDRAGLLHHVGFTVVPSVPEQVRALAGGSGFTGRAPGGPSRWNRGKENVWTPVDPKLVVEVSYDHVTGERFRHATALLRWRPDKSPRQCTLDQLRGSAKASPSRR